MATPILVLVPTADRPAMLAEALASLRAQSDADWVAVVGDDGEGFPAEAAVAAMGGADPRVRWARSFARSPGGTRDAAFRRAEADGFAGDGTLVALLDDDDLWLPHHLARARAALSASPSSPFVHARATTRGAKGDVPYHAKDPGPFSGDLFVPLLRRDFVATSTVVMRVEALRAEGLFRADLSHGEDWDLLLKLSRRGPAAFVDEVEAVHREHGENASLAIVPKARCHVLVLEHWWRRRSRLGPRERSVLARELASRRRRLVKRMAADPLLERREARREAWRQVAAQPCPRTLLACVEAAVAFRRR